MQSSPLTRGLTRSCLLALTVLPAFACSGPAPAADAAMSPVEHGQYLVNLGGCNDCHSPKVYTAMGPVPDTTRLLSGQPAGAPIPAVPAGVLSPDGWAVLTNSHFSAWAGPWGVSFAANLTPDSTGLLGWTPDLFIAALRTGKHAGVGRPILPPMPWPNFAKLTDDDLRAIYAYLQSLPPVSNRVPAPIPPAAPPQ